MIMKNDFPHCPGCKLGGCDWKPQDGDTDFESHLKRFSEGFNWFVQHVHPNTETMQDENHEPAWKKRKSSKC